MKRTVLLVLCTALLLSLFTPVMQAAEADAQQMQQVLQMVKERVDVPEKMSEFTYQKQQSESGTYYHFEWTTKDNQQQWGYLSVSCTVGGIITSYSLYDSSQRGDGKLRLPSMTAEQAKQQAVAALQRLNPLIASNVRLTEDTPAGLYSGGYGFRLVRVENGVEFPANGGFMRLDESGERVASFHLMWWDGVSFPSPSQAISKDAAKQAYGSEIGLQLVYKKKYDYNSKTVSVYPAYVAAKDGFVIDAITGKAIKPNEERFLYEGGELSKADAEKSMGGNFTPQEQREIDAMEGLLSEAQAEQVLRDCDLFQMGDTKLAYSRLYAEQFYPNQYRYQLSFQLPDENAQLFLRINATIDAVTGTVLSYNRYDSDPVRPMSAQPKRIVSKGSKQAEAVFAELAGDKAAQYHIKDTQENSTLWYRMANGIPYLANDARVQFDEEGLLTAYHINYTEDVFPSIDGVISPDQAANKLFEQAQYPLLYIPIYENNATTTPTKTQLVYQLDVSVNIHPFEGYLMDEQGEPIAVIKVPEYTDIAGHYAEAKINALKQAGIYLAGDEFRPDDVLLQKEYVGLLGIVFGGYGIEALRDTVTMERLYAGFASTIVKENEKNPEAPVTREQAALFLVRALGIDEYASISGIYNCPFEDVTSSAGHITILYGMGVVGGLGDGTYQPNQQLNRADAMIILYNYLTR